MLTLQFPAITKYSLLSSSLRKLAFSFQFLLAQPEINKSYSTFFYFYIRRAILYHLCGQ